MHSLVSRGSLCAAVFTCAFAGSAFAQDTLVGASASASTGQRANFGGVTTVGPTTGASDGGEGETFAGVVTAGPGGTAAGTAEAGTLAPSVRARAASVGGLFLDGTKGSVANGSAGAFAAYRYDGATAGTIVVDYAITAATSAPAESDTFIRGQGAVIRDATFIAYSRSQYFEGGGTLLDSFREEFREEDGPTINSVGQMTATVNPGEVFNVMLGLQTSAGGGGASADAFNTLQATVITTTAGGSLTVVPEPASLALAAAGGALLLRRRRAA